MSIPVSSPSYHAWRKLDRRALVLDDVRVDVRLGALRQHLLAGVRLVVPEPRDLGVGVPRAEHVRVGLERRTHRQVAVASAAPSRAPAPASPPSAGVAQRRGDAGDRAQERRADELALLVGLGRAVAAQQLDLDRVHRVDVRVAQPHRALQHRVPVEQLVRLDDRRGRRRPCARARPRSRRRGGRDRARRGRGRGSRARCRGSTSRASSRGCRSTARKNAHSR